MCERGSAVRSLVFLVGDYQRLWAVTGFAERFAAQLAWPGTSDRLQGDPCRVALGEHHRRLAALLHAGGLAGDRGPHELADALTGFYLSRRLAGARLDGWVPTAIQTIIGAGGAAGGDR